MPFPASPILIPYFLTTLLPGTTYIFVLLLINEFSLSETVIIYTSPLTGSVAIICMILIPFLFLKLCWRKITVIDGSQPSIARASAALKTLEMGYIGYVAFMTVPMIAVHVIACVRFRIPYSMVALVLTGFGTMFTMGLLPYIIFVEKLEAYVSSIPVTKHSMTMPHMMRNLCPSFFSSVGLAFLVLSPFIAKNAVFSNLPRLFMMRVIPCTLFGVLICMLTVFVLQRYTTARIQTVTAFADKLQQYDYTLERLNVISRDNIGVLMSDMNGFYGATCALLVSVRKALSLTSTSSFTQLKNTEEISSSITQIVANINSIKTRIDMQVKSVQETKATILDMFEQMKKMEANVGTQSHIVSDSSTAVEEMVANIRSVTEVLNKNAEVVKRLSRASDSGQESVEYAVEQMRVIMAESDGLLDASTIIQSIAEQTNLLAMNAAIEAAHAGTSGKGFAVVADEIRKLAEQSNTQGKAITEQLKKLQNAIETINAGIGQVQEQFSVIYGLTNTVAEQEQIVVDAMQEQSAGSTQVLNAIKTMQHNMRSVSDSSAEMRTGSGQVADRMKQVMSLTEEINGAVTEMQVGTQIIIDASNKLNASSTENAAHIATLQKEVAQFKINDEQMAK